MRVVLSNEDINHEYEWATASNDLQEMYEARMKWELDHAGMRKNGL